MVPLVVRGDVMGSVEVLVELLRSKQPAEFELSVVCTGVGSVSEGDVEMAHSTGGKSHCGHVTSCNGMYLFYLTDVI